MAQELSSEIEPGRLETNFEVAQQQLPSTVEPGRIEKSFEEPPKPESTFEPIIEEGEEVAPPEAAKAIGSTLAGVVVEGSTASAQSLEEEIRDLLATYPQLLASRDNVAAAEEGINRAFADYLPDVSLFADYGYEVTDSPGLRAARGGSLRTPRESATLTVTENLFDGYATSARNTTARLNKSVSEISLETTQQTVIFRGASAYVNVLRHVALIELAVRNEQTIQRQLQLEDERVQRGAGISVDVLQSKSRLQIAKERRVAFEGNLKNAMTRYAQLFDHPPEVGSMTFPEDPVGLIPASLEEARKIALEQNPSAARSERAVDLANELRRGAKSGYFPRIDLVTEFNYEDDEDGVVGTRRDASVKVQATWDLFSGFATRAEVAEAAHRYQAALDDRNQVGRLIVEDVGLAWDQLATVRERVALLRNAVNIAIEVHEARRKMREAGQETVINVLDAENEVFNAQINAVDAEYDGRIAAYRLVLATGLLEAENLFGAATQ